MQYEDIRVEPADGNGHVRLVTLDRPARRNAMTWRMHAELSDAMAAADEDDAVYVVVVTGAPPAFCAGSDMSAGDHTWEAPADEPRRAGLEPFQVRKPVIAAINGHAIGMGLTYPLQCDIRFVAADAKLSFAFTRRGVAPELGSHYLLPRIVGFSNAADLLLSGRTFSGADAAAIGLASRVLPAADVLPAALDYARELATACSPTACAVVKQLLWSALDHDHGATRHVEEKLFAWLATRDDAREGVAAWSERRPPRWQGRPSDRPSWWSV
ncbi:MAG TPA: enoyl-CoA hydratase-related protein [Acidimicrobiia bacterium]